MTARYIRMPIISEQVNGRYLASCNPRYITYTVSDEFFIIISILPDRQALPIQLPKEAAIAAQSITGDRFGIEICIRKKKKKNTSLRPRDYRHRRHAPMRIIITRPYLFTRQIIARICRLFGLFLMRVIHHSYSIKTYFT